MSIRPLSSDLQKKAEAEINEVASRTEEDLQHIKNWLERQPHLNASTDNQWLLSFLRACKFSLQQTKNRLDCFYTMRSLAAEYFIGRNPLMAEFQEFFRQGRYVLLNNPDPAGSRWMFVSLKDICPDDFSLVSIAKVLTMVADYLVIQDDNFAVAGFQGIIDAQNVSFKYVAALTPTLAMKIVTLFHRAYPIRPKEIHIINCSKVIEALFYRCIVLFREELRKKIHFYNNENQKEIYRYIPLSAWPNEYGGSGGSLDDMSNDIKCKIEKHQDWFLEDIVYRSDETKRPGKPKTVTDVFGVEGSFRTLEID